MKLLAPLFVAMIERWVKDFLKDAEIASKWEEFSKALQKKGVISANLKSDYERQLQEFETRGPGEGS